jgi:hypothetical protein
MNRTTRIDSYFSIPTDLAAEFSEWPEFATGRGYDVDLKSELESVRIRLVPEDERGEDSKHVVVVGEGHGRLFEAALGCVIRAMCQHSDNLTVTQWDNQ